MNKSQIRNALAPTGKLRTTINTGNPILARKGTATEEPCGVSVDLAKAIAADLDIELALQVFDSAGEAVTAVTEQRADMGFFALDPVRAESITFTEPYILIEGCYLVTQDSPLQSSREVDAPGIQVVVGKGSAYDLYLSRQLRQAQIVRSETSPGVVPYFMEHQADVAAGVRQQLEQSAEEFGRLRILPEQFMMIQQAMGVPAARHSVASNYLIRFIREAKQSGLVSSLLTRHGIHGASVAPLS
ncbi:transporter substrate-binding domain-containing protein [Saccharospirillum alexandrii]|uniref:transporter substrate-binding domain-containing protein n=1 Tax=Saccharospirillum alexandrii TaxID=2448477 RepID=UPI000FDC5EEA|nr:transporter substrate-binding domain-containing protein [Saccharospirillum alexandrii]